MELRSFFSIGDGMMYPYANLDSFKRSLLMNILFHDRVVFDGTYFFNSKIVKEYFINHNKYRRNKTSLLNYFAKKGIVAPAIKQRQIRTMQGLHQYYTEELYPNPSVFSKIIDPVLKELHTSLDYGMEEKEPVYLNYPIVTEMDSNYYNLINGLFKKSKEKVLEEVAGIDHKWFENIWELSAKWRKDCLKKAVKQTKSKGIGVSFQRSEFLKVIGKEILNKPKNGSSLSYIAEMKARLDKSHADALEFIIATINHYHHIDLAQKYTNVMDFPMFNMASPIVLNNQYNISTKSGDSKNISFKLKLPSFESLLRIEPEQIDLIRTKHLGKYRKALISYSKNSNPDSKNKVKEALEDYFDDLTIVSKAIPFLLSAKIESSTDIVKGSVVNSITTGIKGAVLDSANYLVTDSEVPFSFHATLGGIGIGMLFGFAKKHYLKSKLLSQPFAFEATIPITL